MSTLTSIFHPVLAILADLIAFFYGFSHDYTIAITLLTVLVYLVLTPLFVKQTRSMIEMQRLQPEIKKLQQKYKGRDMDARQKLNEEMMALYKEHGVNPMGGCLPMVIQFPVLIIMYAVIRGLLNLKTHKNTVGKAVDVLVNGQKVADPKYISHSSALFKSLVAAHGKMVSMGVDIAQSAQQHHASLSAALPYYALVIGAAALSVGQMWQMTVRNRKMMEQTPQMKQMQRMQLVMPLVMAFIYWRLPAVLSIYFIVSSLYRIAMQELMYRFDPVLVAHVDAALARQPGTGAKSPTAASGGAKAKSGTPAGSKPSSSAASSPKVSPTPTAASSPTADQAASTEVSDGPSEKSLSAAGDNSGDGSGTSEDGPTRPVRERTRRSNRRPQGAKATGSAEVEAAASKPQSHPRSKAKRPRKAR